MKILLRKLRYRYEWVKNWCRIGIHLAFVWTPWGTAYIVTALRKYLESDWYKTRSSIFVKRRAYEMYFDQDESWFFKRRITTKERWAILLRPYTFIEKARTCVQEKGLADYV